MVNRIAAISTAASALLGCVAEKRPDPAPRDQAPQVLRIEARDFAFTVPEQVRAGLVRVRLVNHGREWHEALVTRLADSVSTDAYLASARAGDAFPAGAFDVGGPGKVAMGDSSEVVIKLEPGRYAVVCWSDNHVKAGMIASVVVAVDSTRQTGEAATGQGGGDSATPGSPAATGELRLEDFRIAHDSGVYKPGRNVLHIRNTGARPHDVTFYRLEPGRTPRDFGVWYATRNGPPPAVPVGGMVTLAAGREGWAELDLSPGQYLVACGTPEPGPNGVQLHAQMGMVDVFEIPG